MPLIVPVNLAYNPRNLWFSPEGFEIKKGDKLVVSTARGTEFGIASDDVFEVEEKAVNQLPSPLRPVLRLATEEDEQTAAELEEKSREAMSVFREMVNESGIDMHPVSVEFLFSGDKAIFYFEAEERVDFRNLVRKLASYYHVRIDMRQIGVRDEARIVGGLAHCGQELCCARLGGTFNPVSIRMAKEQDLSLNPQKISGLCGRLMCCLRYEYEAYKDFKSRAPKLNATIETPEGDAVVVELDMPREVVVMRVGDEKPMRVPLSAFETPKEGQRPHKVGSEAWDEARASAGLLTNNLPTNLLTTQLTGNDKLSDGAVHRRAGTKAGAQQGASKSEKSQEKGVRGDGKARGKSGRGQGSHAAQTTPGTKNAKGTKGPQSAKNAKTGSASKGAQDNKPRLRRQQDEQAALERGTGSGTRQRRRRSVKLQGSSGAPVAEPSRATKVQQEHPRPGQHSSGLRNPQNANNSKGSDGQASSVEKGSHRRSRNRTHRNGNKQQDDK